MKRTYLLLTAAAMMVVPAIAMASGCQPTSASKAVDVTSQNQSVNLNTDVVHDTRVVSTPVVKVVDVTSQNQSLNLNANVPNDTIVVKEAQSNYGSGSKAPVQAISSPHAAFTNILRKYVSAPDGQGLTHFNYGGLKAASSDKSALDNYIKGLEQVNPSNLSRNDAIAYYANLYNAVTVQVVTENYPVSSIKKLGPLGSGPWKKNLFTINGKPASLNNVEHDIMRKQFPSPYVHYMVNCASVGCPNLLNTAWEGSTIDNVKQKAASDYINSPRGVQITPKGLKVSSIFKWFAEDFGGKSGLLQHIRKHARPELAAAIDSGAKVVDYDYDWSLNE